METLVNDSLHASIHHTGSKIVNDELFRIFHIVNLATLATIVASFGVVTNILNIIVFVKQGFGDTVNVSLLALALSDLCSLITLLWLNLLWNPLFTSQLPFIPAEVMHLSAAWPHAFFAKTTSWITVYITFERCLCVALPLKVKRIVTPKLAITVFVIILLVMALTLVPEFSTAYLDWRYDERYNRTMLGLKFLPGREKMEAGSFVISAVTQISSFLCVIFFTTILVVKMKQKAKWRKSTSHTGQDSSKESTKSRRDNRTVKMIISIAVIYCTCFLPMAATYLVSGIVPEFIIEGQLHNLFLSTWSFAFLLESVNSSINVFVYYNMSSKYRTTVDDMIKCQKKTAIT